jgi:hypothetical protein
MSFTKIPRRRSYRERFAMVAERLNKEGSIDVRDIVVEWNLSPNYARQLLVWASEKFPYAKWDDDTDTLYIPERKEGEAKKP